VSQASDYANFTGEIALVLRNNLDDCTVLEKVTAAASAGASAILIWTDESYGIFSRGRKKLAVTKLIYRS
jgi:hypothetical protein